MAKRFLLLHLLLLLGISVSQAATETEVTAEVAPTEITVGDVVRYTITVTHPAASKVAVPAVRGNTGTLEVTGFTMKQDTAADGRLVESHILTLAAYEVGHDTLPPQRVEIRTAGDTGMTVLYTQPTVLSVRPTAPANARDIADIEDGERLPGAIPWALPLLLAGIAAAFWAYRKYRDWKRRRASRPEAVAPVPLFTAAESALARLEALENAGPPSEPRFFAFTLSEILREYLAARFGIDALEATTSELLARTAPLPLPPDQHVWLGESSVELDTVKFATGRLTAADATRLLTSSRAFVQATADSPVAEPEPDPEPAA